MDDTADTLPQASDAEINELIGAPSEAPAKPSTPQPSGSTPQPSASASQPSASATQGQPQGQQPAAPQSPLARLGKKAERDYSGFTDEEIAYFKKMGNDTFDWIAPIYRKYKSGQPPEDVTSKLTDYEKRLKEAEERQWFDHPDSYQLSDEYRQAQQTYGEAQAVAQHWQQQLVAVDGGAKEYTGLRYDANGQIVTVKVPVTPATRADLIQRMQVAQSDVATVRQEMEAVKGTHSKRYGTYKGTLEEIYEKNFKPHEAVLKKHYDKIIEGFPAWFRNRPEARLLAASLASNEVITEHYNGQAGTQAATQIFQNASASAGPTKAALGSGLPAKSESSDGKKPFKLPTPEEEKAFAATYL